MSIKISKLKLFATDFAFRSPKFFLRAAIVLSVMMVYSSGSSASENPVTVCPVVRGASEIQSQFQLLQHAAPWISDVQERELKLIFQQNADTLNQFGCYSKKGNDPNALSDILAAIKLQILRIRYLSYKKDHKAIAEALLAMRKMSGSFQNQSSLMARRLGASVRSLLLDELERLIDLQTDLVREEVRLGYWRSDLNSGIENEIIEQWMGVKAQLPRSATPTSLARHFGFRNWVPPQAYRSKIARFLSRFKVSQDGNLEEQLKVIFKTNAENIDMVETERAIRHYLTLALAELKKNSYFIIKPWLDPVIDEKVQALKSELGVSWPLISPLVGVQLEGPFKEVDQPIELLDNLRLAQAKTHYARVKNPLGRLYEIVFLKRLTQMWTQVDVVQLRSDLNRVSFLKTLLAVQDYQKRFARWPASVEDLVDKKMLREVPKDYFTGKNLRYDSKNRQIWSVGENGIDEKGRGDDISLSLSL